VRIIIIKKKKIDIDHFNFFVIKYILKDVHKNHDKWWYGACDF